MELREESLEKANYFTDDTNYSQSMWQKFLI